jgi:hypothetical protein
VLVASGTKFFNIDTNVIGIKCSSSLTNKLECKPFENFFVKSIFLAGTVGLFVRSISDKEKSFITPATIFFFFTDNVGK